MANGLKSVNDTIDAAGHAASDAAHEAVGKAERLKKEALDVAHDLQDKAADAAHKAGETARSAAASAKDYAADGAHSLADAAREVADKIGKDGQGAKVAEYTRKAADGLDRFSDTLKSKNVDELAEDARSAVRKHPAIAVGAAAVIGFALARFLKSSGNGRQA